MNERELLLYILTKQFNKTENELAPLIFGDDNSILETAGDAILDLNAKKIADIKKENQTFFDNGFKKAEKQFKGEAEKVFKEKTGYNGDKVLFDEMLDDFVSNKPPVKITDDEVKKHPLFISLEANRVSAEDFNSVKTQFEDYKKGVERDKLMSGVKNRAWSLVEPKRPILSDNPDVARTRREDFLVKFDGYDYEPAGDDFVVLKEGKRVEDKQGNAITLSKLVDQLSTVSFDFPAQSDRGNAGNVDIPSVGTMNDQQYIQAVQNAKTPEERVKLKQAWDARQ